MDIKIRDAATKDLDAMVALLIRLFTIETDFKIDPARHKQGLALILAGCRKHKCIKVASANDEVVGMCTAQTLISTAEGGRVALVEDLVIAPEFRRHGIGKKLMAAIEEWAKAQGVSRLQLLADHTNQPALDFYDMIGWQTTRMICLRRKW